MFKQSWASLGQNIHYLGVICLIFFPLVALTFLANIFGVYWGMNDALSACRNALAGQDLTALNHYADSAYASLNLQSNFETAYHNFSSWTWPQDFFKGLKELLTSSYPGQASALTSSIDQAGVKIFWFQLFATANFYGTCALAYYIPMARVWSKQVKRKFSTGFFAFLFQVVVVSLSVAGIKKLGSLWAWGWVFSLPLASFVGIFLNLTESWFIEGRKNRIPYFQVVNWPNVALGGLFEAVVYFLILGTFGALGAWLSPTLAFTAALPLVFYVLICSAVKCDHYVMSLLRESEREKKY
jgi:hypothetical protein